MRRTCVVHATTAFVRRLKPADIQISHFTLEGYAKDATYASITAYLALLVDVGRVSRLFNT